jgi:RNA 3'-terminal phosphate cyclase (ATP)
MIEIDGSAGEGGGQIVRTAVSLAAVTGRGVEIVRVRERRERPGLQPQHLAAVRAAAAICDATTVGDRVGSRHLLFEPGRAPASGDYVFDVRTAGAATLVMQTVLVPLLRAEGESSIEVIGGTHQPMSPPADYLQHVYAPALGRFGEHVEAEYGPAGYYPRGGGRVRAIVAGGTLGSVELVDRGRRESLDAYVVTSGLAEHVAERGAATISELVPDARIHVIDAQAFSRGAAVTLVARHVGGLGGFSSIGRPGLPMERVASGACQRFLEWNALDAACDEHLSDQLVLPACLGKATSQWTTPRVTEHLRTVLGVAEAFVPMSWTIADGLVQLTPG